MTPFIQPKKTRDFRPVGPLLRNFAHKGEAGGLPCSKAMPALTEAIDNNLPQTCDGDIQAAFERGKAVAFQQLSEELEITRRMASENLEVEIQARRELWVHSESERLTSQVQHAFEALTSALARDVALVMQPFIKTHLKEKAVQDFAKAVRRLHEDGTIKLQISGPEDLLDALQRQLHDMNISIECEVGCNNELSLRHENTMISTRLGEWLQGVENAIDGVQS